MWTPGWPRLADDRFARVRRPQLRSFGLLPPAAALPFQLDAGSALMGLHRGAKLGIIIEIESGGVAQAERSRCAGIRAISTLTDSLHGDALGTEADGDRTEILRDVVDELAVAGQIENHPVDDPIVADLRTD